MIWWWSMIYESNDLSLRVTNFDWLLTCLNVLSWDRVAAGNSFVINAAISACKSAQQWPLGLGQHGVTGDGFVWWNTWYLPPWISIEMGVDDAFTHGNNLTHWNPGSEMHQLCLPGKVRNTTPSLLWKVSFWKLEILDFMPNEVVKWWLPEIGMPQISPNHPSHGWPF